MNSAPVGEGLVRAVVDPRAVDLLAPALRRVAEAQDFREEAWDDPRYWNVEASRSDRCQFLAVGNAINFRFWSLSGRTVIPAMGTIQGEELRGSMYMWRRLRLAVQDGEFSLEAGDLAQLTEAALTAAFRDDEGRLPLAEGLEDRLANLQDLGSELRDNWHGLFEQVVDASAGSLSRFAELSAGFRAFDDPVQKLTMLNAIMLQGSGLTTFDQSPLPAIDYHLVKQATRQGLVRLDEQLESRLRDGSLLEREESDALRMAVRRGLTAVAAAAGVSSALLDNVYWLNKRVCADTEPRCGDCQLRSGCAMKVDLGLPLEVTRYY